MTLTAERLRELLDYDQWTGIFTRRTGRYAGCVAGNSCTFGHWQIYLIDRRYSAHRLAWLYVHGYWPPKDIDHINRNPGDNRIINLRLATRQQNAHNRRAACTNTSGYKGVSLHGSGRWCASITADGHYQRIGLYRTRKAASDAYNAAAAKLHGRFACFEGRAST